MNENYAKLVNLNAIQEQVTLIGSEYHRLQDAYNECLDKNHQLVQENEKLKFKLNKIQKSLTWKIFKMIISPIIILRKKLEFNYFR